MTNKKIFPKISTHTTFYEEITYIWICLVETLRIIVANRTGTSGRSFSQGG